MLYSEINMIYVDETIKNLIYSLYLCCRKNLEHYARIEKIFMPSKNTQTICILNIPTSEVRDFGSLYIVRSSQASFIHFYYFCRESIGFPTEEEVKLFKKTLINLGFEECLKNGTLIHGRPQNGL